MTQTFLDLINSVPFPSKGREYKYSRSYDEAQTAVLAAGIRGYADFRAWKERPDDIPMNPQKVYKGNGWVSWPVFVKNGRQLYVRDGRHAQRAKVLFPKTQKVFRHVPPKPKPTPKKEWMSYEDAETAVRQAGITTKEQFQQWERPEHMPSSPSAIYAGKGWVSWGAFLGTGYVHSRGSWLAYKETQRLVQAAGIKSWTEYRRWKERPDDIPRYPSQAYAGKGWISAREFFGGKNIVAYSEAQRIVQAAGIKTCEEYRVWERPAGMPSNPNKTYKHQGWVSWGDFLGTGSVRGSNSIAKENGRRAYLRAGA